MTKSQKKAAPARTPAPAKKAPAPKATAKAAPAPAKAAARPVDRKAGGARPAGRQAAPATAATPAPAKKKGKQPTIGSLAAGAIAQLRGAQAPTSALQEAGSGDTVCREVACENLATTAGFCRLHYIKNWKKIKRKEVILREGKLNQYIEELVAKYPDKYIEAIRQDLANDKEFAKVINDLDLDEGIDDFESDSEGLDTLIDNLKASYDDDGDAF